MTNHDAFNKAVSKWSWTFFLGVVVIVIPTLLSYQLPSWVPWIVLILWGVGLLMVVVDILKYRRQSK